MKYFIAMVFCCAASTAAVVHAHGDAHVGTSLIAGHFEAGMMGKIKVAGQDGVAPKI